MSPIHCVSPSVMLSDTDPPVKAEVVTSCTIEVSAAMVPCPNDSAKSSPRTPVTTSAVKVACAAIRVRDSAFNSPSTNSCTAPACITLLIAVATLGLIPSLGISGMSNPDAIASSLCAS